LGGASNGGSTAPAQGGAALGGGASGGALGGSSTTGPSGGVGAAGSSDPCGVRPGLLFCEDFEDQAVGIAPSGPMWSTSFIGSEAPEIAVDDATPAHSGARSVRVRAPSANFQSFLIYHDAAILPRESAEFYLRVELRIGREMSGGHNAYLIADRAAMPGAGNAVRFGEMNRMLSLSVGGDSHGALSNDDFYDDQVLGPRFVANEWSCLEGFFKTDPAEINFWLDGKEVADFHHTDWPADNYDALRFGFEKYAGPELEIWFDDIAIGAERIGCN
jgi:hypothetical protein